jgi:hypothetical protein
VQIKATDRQFAETPRFTSALGRDGMVMKPSHTRSSGMRSRDFPLLRQGIRYVDHGQANGGLFDDLLRLERLFIPSFANARAAHLACSAPTIHGNLLTSDLRLNAGIGAATAQILLCRRDASSPATSARQPDQRKTYSHSAAGRMAGHGV